MSFFQTLLAAAARKSQIWKSWQCGRLAGWLAACSAGQHFPQRGPPTLIQGAFTGHFQKPNLSKI
jgi:hypothetical protein